MAKMNWDKVRTETLMRNHGSERISDTGDEPRSYGHWTNAQLKRTPSKPSSAKQKTQRCQVCGVPIRLNRVQRHMKRAHPANSTPLTKTGGDQQVVAGALLKKNRIRTVLQLRKGEFIPLDTLCTELAPQCTKIDPRRFIENLVCTLGRGTCTPPEMVSTVVAAKVRSFIRECLPLCLVP